MRVLLVAEHDNRILAPSCERIMTAALQLAPEVDVLVAGLDCHAAAEAAAGLAGVSRVRWIDASCYAEGLVENLAMVLAQFAAGYTHVLCAASSLGRALIPRVAAMLDVAPLSGVNAILGPTHFVRPTHAGSVLETVRCDEPIKLLTLQASAFAPLLRRQPVAPVEPLAAGPEMGVSRVLRREIAAQAGRPTLGAARVVVAGGRGLGSAAAFENLLVPLAERFNAALAATRAAVDAGYAPNAWQVGQTGHSVAPALYIAVGISGAPQHLSGMRGAGCIVAINQDADAPIFGLADLALVGDLHQLVPQLIAELLP